MFKKNTKLLHITEPLRAVKDQSLDSRVTAGVKLKGGALLALAGSLPDLGI